VIRKVNGSAIKGYAPLIIYREPRPAARPACPRRR
jgi:hypothetical protein